MKPFGEGKSRLAATLAAAERDALSRRWLAHVLEVAHGWGKAAGVLVVSRDPAVLDLARRHHAHTLAETGDDLNPALEQARAAVIAAGGDAVLVLPSDLPLLSMSDLDELRDLMLEGPGMVLAPSHDGGTNALLLRPPRAIPYAFGEDSSAQHRALAAAAGIPARIYHSSTLALDIDHPEDLLALPAAAAR